MQPARILRREQTEDVEQERLDIGCQDFVTPA
jgi:hypothetical protein